MSRPRRLVQPLAQLPREVLVFFVVTAGQGFSIGAGFVLYVVLLQRRGMDLFEIGIINAVFAGGIALLQLPTGVFADLYGRRKSLIYGSVVSMLGRILYSFAPDLGFFCAAEAMFAIAWAFTAGADYAWLTDRSPQLDYHPGETTYLLTRTDLVKKGGTLLGGLAGSVLGLVNDWLPMFMSGIVLIPVIWLLIVYLEPDAPKVSAGRSSLGSSIRLAATTSKLSAQRVISDQRLLVLGLAYGVYAAAWVSPFTNDWQPFLGVLGARSLVFGLVLYFTLAGTVLVRYALPPAIARYGISQSYIPVVGLAGCAVLLPVLTLIHQLAAAIAVYVVLYLFSALVFSMETLYAEALGPHPNKASILSIQSMLYYLGFCLGSIGSGALAHRVGLANAWRTCAAVFGVVGLACAITAHSRRTDRGPIKNSPSWERI